MPDKIGLVAMRLEGSGDEYGPVLADRILARWLENHGDISDVPGSALYFLPPSKDKRVLDYYEKALRDERLADDSVRAMGRACLPETLPLLESCLKAEWLSGSIRVGFRREAVLALTNYMNDAAVDILLRAIANATDDDFRKRCFDGLESIRKYQDERARWDKRKLGQDARERAVAEVLPMLEDKNAMIRTQAALAIGTLGAIEEMPRLIRLLKDPEASVRNAAQKALDQLNTTPPPAASPTTTPKKKEEQQKVKEDG